MYEKMSGKGASASEAHRLAGEVGRVRPEVKRVQKLPFRADAFTVAILIRQQHLQECQSKMRERGREREREKERESQREREREKESTIELARNITQSMLIMYLLRGY